MVLRLKSLASFCCLRLTTIKNCHASYVKPTKLKSDDANSLYDKAIENFATYFEKRMKDGNALRMDTGFQKYQQNLTDVGVKDEDAARYTNAKLKVLEIASGLRIKNIKMSLKLYTAVILTSKS